MSVSIFAEGVLKNLASMGVTITGDVTKEVSSIERYNGATLDLIWPPSVPPPPPPPPVPPPPPPPPPSALSVTCDPISVYKKLIGDGPITTRTVTAVITGGTAPFTVAWEPVSWTNTTVTPLVGSPTSTTTTFTATDVPDDETVEATFRVTVGDALGGIASAQCAVSFHRVSLTII